MNESFQYEYILLNVDKPVFSYDFQSNHPLVLGQNAEMGVRSLFMWYTYPNISEKYDNNKVKVFYKNSWHEIIIPTGMYEVKTLNNFLNNAIAHGLKEEESSSDGSTFVPSTEKPAKTYLRLTTNTATFKIRVIFTGGIQLDLSEGNLYKLLGLDPKVYSKSEEGPNIVNITRGVDRVLLRCNIVERKHQKHFRDVLYDIMPFSEPGSAIQEQIDHVEYHNCKDNQIRRIEIRVTDSSNNLIDLIEPISLKIVFRHKLP